MENVVIELIINKWMLWVIVVAIFLSLVSNILAVYARYLRAEIEKERSKNESAALNLPDVSNNEVAVCQCFDSKGNMHQSTGKVCDECEFRKANCFITVNVNNVA